MGRKKKEPEVKLPAITQLPSGAWHTRVLIGERRVSITKATYEECVSEYLALKHGVMEAKKAPAKRGKTLKESVNEYIDSRREERSPATIGGYEKDARNMFQAAMEWDVFTTTDEQWQRAIRDERRKGRSAKYIKNSWMLMAAAIEAATGRRPKVNLYPNESEERLFLEPEQIDIFVEAVKGKPVEIPALLCLSSLRRSEMLALKWNNVDLAKGTINVHGATVRGGTGLVEKKQNKTDKSRRTIPIIPPLLAALEAVDHKTDHVVTMGGDTALKQVKKLCRENGLPEVGLHGLRHSFASLAYHLEIPEMIAAEIGGWDDLGTMHKIYTHLATADIAKRSQDFCAYFDAEKRQKRAELATELATESKNT